MTDPSSSSPLVKKRLLVTLRGSIDGAMEKTSRAGRRSCKTDSIDYAESVSDVNDDETHGSLQKCVPASDNDFLSKGEKYYIYDSDEEDGDDHRPMVLKEGKRPWDAQAVREGVRPELVYPGRKWDDEDYSAFFPQVKSAEFYLRSTLQVEYWSNLSMVRIFSTPGNDTPRHVSVYLAAETLIRMVKSSNVDKLWEMAHDMEEYIRQALWPRSMQADAERIDKGLPSDVVALAKVIPRAYTPGFNNDGFWGRAVYVALCFPPALHPYKTPIVRDMIGRLRACSKDDEDMWSSSSQESTITNLAATWAGYHIARHLIDKNAYHLGRDEIQILHRDLDNLVRAVSRKHPQIQVLFRDTISSTIPDGRTEEEFNYEGSVMRWDIYAGSCHVVDLNNLCALPPPLRKPSIILQEMQAEQPRSDDRPWDETKPFTTQYDGPPRKQAGDTGRIRLSLKLTKTVKKVNARLFDFLNSHSVEKSGRDTLPPATPANSTGLLEEMQAIRSRCEELELGITTSINQAKHQVISGQTENKKAMERMLVTSEERLLGKIQSIVSVKREVKQQILASQTESKQAMESMLAKSEQRVLERFNFMMRTALTEMKEDLAKHITDIRNDMKRDSASLLEDDETRSVPKENNASSTLADSGINQAAFPPPQVSAVNSGAMLQAAQQWQAQPWQANPFIGSMQAPMVNPSNLNFNGNPFASQWPMGQTAIFPDMNHIDRPLRRPASVDAFGHVDRRPRLNTDRANNRRQSDDA